MGIYDRHYYREAPRRPQGLEALSGWSVNTWLIVICVAVFMLDSTLLLKYQKPVPFLSNLPVEAELQLGTRYRVDNLVQVNRAIYTSDVYDMSVQPPQKVGEIAYRAMTPLQRWLHFSTHLAIQKVEFWRFIGFQFLHADLSHLLFNMVGLFFFGPIVEQHLGPKRYLAFYLLCGIFGALLYLFLNLGGMLTMIGIGETIRVPGLLFSSMFTPLVGASAGIFGVLMAGAFLLPRAEVLLFFILPMRLKTMAYVLVAVALYTVITGGANAGGEAGHLGGAIAGFYFIRRQHHLHGFFDFLGRVDPTSHHYRHGKSSRHRTGKPSKIEVDRILDKINREGLHSLTDVEKRILSESSRRES